MGLSVCVGFLSDQRRNDPEGYVRLKQSFATINKVLAAHGIPPYDEPDNVKSWSASMIGYSNLHYLRRLAAYVDSGTELPSPGDRNSSKDERLRAYYEALNNDRPQSRGASLAQPRNSPEFQRGFDHLINHSDAAGFYLPQDFEHVIVTGTESIPGGQLGSAPRLLAECERLARILQIPPHVTERSRELSDAVQYHGNSEAHWERYGFESYACVILQTACRKSIADGTAIVFT